MQIKNNHTRLWGTEIRNGRQVVPAEIKTHATHTPEEIHHACDDEFLAELALDLDLTCENPF